MCDPTNEERAGWAEAAVNTFGRLTYCDRSFSETVKEQPEEDFDAYTMLQDLIANCLHLAEKHGWDPELMLKKSVEDYHFEVAEELEEARDAAQS